MRTEKIIALFVLLGFVSKIFNIPGSSILTVVSLTAMAMIYMGGGFYFFCDGHIRNQNIALSIVTGFFLSIVQVGIIFKIMFWPGSTFDLIIGIITTPILLLITLILKTKAKEKLRRYYQNMLLRISIWTILAYLFFFISSETLIDLQYRNDPERAKLLKSNIKDLTNKEYEQSNNKQME